VAGTTATKKKSKTAWIVGGIVLVVVLACGLGFTACTALNQSINGGGGSQAEKAAAMMARADKVPQKDWVEV
jgi:flagellar basal body-associated protein FliL